MSKPLATEVAANLSPWVYAPPQKLNNGASMAFLRGPDGVTPEFQLCGARDWSVLPFGISEPKEGTLPAGTVPAKKNCNVEVTPEFAAAIECMEEYDQATAVANMHAWFPHVWNDKKKGIMYDTDEKKEQFVRANYKSCLTRDDPVFQALQKNFSEDIRRQFRSLHQYYAS